MTSLGAEAQLPLATFHKDRFEGSFVVVRVGNVLTRSHLAAAVVVEPQTTLKQ